MSASMPAPEPPRKTGSLAKKVISSEELFGNAREVIITHGDAEYRLQRTKPGKLILTK